MGRLPNTLTDAGTLCRCWSKCCRQWCIIKLGFWMIDEDRALPQPLTLPLPPTVNQRRIAKPHRTTRASMAYAAPLGDIPDICPPESSSSSNEWTSKDVGILFTGVVASVVLSAIVAYGMMIWAEKRSEKIAAKAALVHRQMVQQGALALRELIKSDIKELFALQANKASEQNVAAANLPATGRDGANAPEVVEGQPDIGSQIAPVENEPIGDAPTHEGSGWIASLRDFLLDLN